MKLFKTSKTSSRIYLKPVKPVAKRSNLCLKMRLIEGDTELWAFLKKFQRQI